MEDAKAMDQAKRANEARKTLKEFKQRHGADLHKGQDARSHQPMIDKKKQKMMSKLIANKNSNSRKEGGGRSYSAKAKDKIQQSARPTRSKMIVKGPSGRTRR